MVNFNFSVQHPAILLVRCAQKFSNKKLLLNVYSPVSVQTSVWRQKWNQQREKWECARYVCEIFHVFSGIPRAKNRKALKTAGEKRTTISG
jgi:hypothetical protein